MRSNRERPRLKDLSGWPRSLPEVRKGVGVGRRGRVQASGDDLALRFFVQDLSVVGIRQGVVRIVAQLRKRFVVRVARKLGMTIGLRRVVRSSPARV